MADILAELNRDVVLFSLGPLGATANAVKFCASFMLRLRCIMLIALSPASVGRLGGPRNPATLRALSEATLTLLT